MADRFDVYGEMEHIVAVEPEEALRLLVAAYHGPSDRKEGETPADLKARLARGAKRREEAAYRCYVSGLALIERGAV